MAFIEKKKRTVIDIQLKLDIINDKKKYVIG